LFILGGAFVATSILGKGFITVYRRAKTGNLFKNAATLGKYHFGGFEAKMSRREASKILGIRESALE